MTSKSTKPSKKRKKADSPAPLSPPFSMEAKLAETNKLLRSIKAKLPALNKLLDRTAGHEDLIYRYYHQSFKVYLIQEYTKEIVAGLQSLAPHLPLNDWFMEIVRQGTGREFSIKDNLRWTAITRPMLEAYFHARYFLEMACQYSRELTSAPKVLPSGWAALLYLYNIR
jgi:hypothetical protein